MIFRKQIPIKPHLRCRLVLEIYEHTAGNSIRRAINTIILYDSETTLTSAIFAWVFGGGSEIGDFVFDLRTFARFLRKKKKKHTKDSPHVFSANFANFLSVTAPGRPRNMPSGRFPSSRPESRLFDVLSHVRRVTISGTSR